MSIHPMQRPVLIEAVASAIVRRLWEVGWSPEPIEEPLAAQWMQGLPEPESEPFALFVRGVAQRYSLGYLQAREKVLSGDIDAHDHDAGRDLAVTEELTSELDDAVSRVETQLEPFRQQQREECAVEARERVERYRRAGRRVEYCAVLRDVQKERGVSD